AAKVRSMIADVNAKPVYTIHEMLEGKVLAPTDAIVVGGPAPYMAKQIGKLLKMAEIVPGDSDVINASGAAMARTTVELTLMADTEERLMSVAEEGVLSDIPRGFTMDDLIDIGREKLENIARIAGAPEEDIEIEVADSQSFNVIRGTATTGKNFRVRLQIKPGLTKHATEHAIQ
ncbi:MAG TPA: hypothetical protein VL550_07230, partial [Rhodocyclaceae bacterium]|nr:hypothetical protein [Rhodocyclaceae bacterium]